MVLSGWFPDENEFTLIHFGKDRVGTTSCGGVAENSVIRVERQGFLLVTGEISKVLLDPTGFHALMTNSSGDTWYLNYQSHLACKALKLFGC